MPTSTLTDEQRARIAKNKEEALRRRAERIAKEQAENGGYQATQTQNGFLPTQTQNGLQPTQTQNGLQHKQTQNWINPKPSATQDIICLSSRPTLSFLPKTLPQFSAPPPNPNVKPYASCVTAVSTSVAPQKAAAPQQLPSVQQPVSLPQQQQQKSSSIVHNPKLQPINHDSFPLFGPKSNQITSKSPTAAAAKHLYRPPAMAQMPKSQVQATFKLMSEDRIKVTFHPFHQGICNALKTVKSRWFDEQTRAWSIGIEDAREAANVLKAVKECDVKVEQLPENVLQMMSNFHPEPVPDDLSTVIDGPIVAQLFPYQRAGVRFTIARAGRAMIADEMGLGKSVQALAAARYYRNEWPLMIVCPSSVKAAWKHQLNTFLPHIQRIYTVEKASDPMPDARTSNTVVIMSYDLMSLKLKELENKQYSVLILDECHMLKDMKAKRTKAAISLAKKATRVIMLSGTPALSRPAELFSQIRIINDRLFTNFQTFAIRYCDGKQGRFCFEAKGSTNSEELTAILKRRIMIRRLKNEVLTELPEKRREIVYLSGSAIDSRMDSLQKAKAAFEASNNGVSASNESLMEYYNATGIVKAGAVCEHILDNYFHAEATPRKVLIFGHHQIVLDTIQVEVNKRKLRSIRIDGKTAAKDRGPLCEEFQTNPDVVVAILSVTAAGVGITLTAASVVVFAELHWNPGTLMQAEDRAHRVGQRDSVFVQYLIARNTADDQIWPMLQDKLDLLGQVKLSSDTFRDAESTHMDCGTPVTKRRKINKLVFE